MTSTREPQALISAEKQFLFRDSFNKGYIQLPRMIAACLCLSSQARAVYSAISMFVYEQGRTAFPSMHRIALICSMAVKSVIKHVRELEDKGFIRTTRRGGGMTNDYHIVDLHEIKALRVSELVWEVLKDIANDEGERSWKRVDEAWKKIVSMVNERKASLTQINCTDEIKEQIKAAIVTTMEGGTPELVFIQSVKNKTKTAGTAGKDNTRTDKRTGKSYLDMEETKWRTDDLIDYFYRRYLDLTGTAHTSTQIIHRSIISRALKQLDGDKVMLRKYIDTFFEIGYDNPSLEHFGTSGRFAEITLYQKEGKKPFYLEPDYAPKQKKEAAKAEQQHLGFSEEEVRARLEQRRRAKNGQ